MDLGKLLFSFSGRLNRAPYWAATLPLNIILLILSTVSQTSREVPVVPLLLMLPFLWMGLAVGVKRCHDRDWSGWFLLVGLIPFVGGFWAFIELGCLRGTEGPNRFGPDPLATVSLGEALRS